jgi:hypothetical protein
MVGLEKTNALVKDCHSADNRDRIERGPFADTPTSPAVLSSIPRVRVGQKAREPSIFAFKCAKRCGHLTRSRFVRETARLCQ